MMNNKYLETLIEKAEKSWDSMSGGEKSVARMYNFSKREGFDALVSGWDGSVRKEDAEEFVKAIRESGIQEFFIISDFSNQLSEWLALDKAGMKLCGICEIDNPQYIRDMENWGRSRCDEKTPALKFVLKEVE